MYILGIRVDQLSENDIIRLIDNQIQENKSLDYKKEFHISKDSDKKEFLFDVSAMYNTDGGCLVYGIEEEKDENGQNTGKPLKISGIENTNTDKLIQQIEDVIKNCTEPSINQLLIKELEIDKKKVLIIGIPKCLGLPSMVTYNQTNKFFKRRNSGKYAVDVYELNQMFMQKQVLSEKANKFRLDRIKNVLELKSIPNLDVNNSIFVHIIPFGFLDYQILDFSNAENNLTLKMRPLYSNGWDKMYNIDGFSTFSTSKARNKISSYNQIFRNGIYEVYSSDLFYQTRHNSLIGFDGEYTIQEIIRCVKEGLFVLNEMKVEPPFLISFSFHNVKDKIMENESNYQIRSFKQNEIVFPLILVPNYDSDIKLSLKPNFDILWQSFGYSKSPIQ